MLKLIPKIINIILVLFVLKMAYQRYEIWQEQKQIHEQKLNLPEILSMEKQPINISKFNKPMVLFFWASWCTPCKVELSRLNALIKNNEIPKENVLAVAVWDDFSTVNQTIKERGYLFNNAFDSTGNLAAAFHVKATPSQIFIDHDAKVVDIKNGLSLFIKSDILNHIKANN